MLKNGADVELPAREGDGVHDGSRSRRPEPFAELSIDSEDAVASRPVKVPKVDSDYFEE